MWQRKRRHDKDLRFGATCRSFAGNYGKLPLGTVAENPAGFAVCTAALALGVGGCVYCAYRSHRMRREG
jgi:hypothetical protein